MFRKSLTDIVRGIRSNKKNEAKFISQCLQEIKEELKNEAINIKAVAIQKLVYLQMFGYDVSWSAFNIVEVMANPKFSNKRIAYLAASQTFNEKTEVSMLTINLLKKDFINNKNVYEAGIAINCLANICNTDLARDLAPDIVSMLTSSRPYIRKKAVLVLFKIFLKYPEALRPSFNRLKEKLDDPDPSVVSAAVHVICELARKNPKNYLGLAPTLFKLLTRCTNNWMLIKIIKLFSALTPLEPRLGKKLVEPLTNLINNTNAMSLLYECIQTCIIGLKGHVNVLRICLSKLRMFIEHPDQNLKYLGLVALGNIMKVFPKGISDHRELVLGCLDDEDMTIRTRSLDLLSGMVSKKNLQSTITKLISLVEEAEGHYRDDLLEKIINICSQEQYKFIVDFEWFISILMDLSKIQGSKHGPILKDQLLNVCVRVEVVRRFGVEQMTRLLNEPRFLTEDPQAGGPCEALYAAAYIVGEFCSLNREHLIALEALLQPRAAILPPHIQSVYLHNILKIFTELAKNKGEQAAGQKSKVEKALEIIQEKLPVFMQSQYLEVQERACFLNAIVDIYRNQSAQGNDISSELELLFEEALNPVSNIAQKKVQAPEGLDLDAWINEPPKWDDIFDDHARPVEGEDDWQDWTDSGNKHTAVSKEELVNQKETNRKIRYDNPWYLDPSARETEIPEVKPLEPEGLGLTGGDIRAALRGKNVKGRRLHKQYTVNVAEEMPEGFDPNQEPTEEPLIDGSDLSNIDLTNISPTEALPVLQHRVVASSASSTTPQVKDPNMLKDPEAAKRLERRKRHEEKKKRHEERKKRHQEKKTGTKPVAPKTTPASKPPTSSNSTGLLLNFDIPSEPQLPSENSNLSSLMSPSTASSNFDDFLINTASPSAVRAAPVPAVSAPPTVTAPVTASDPRGVEQKPQHGREKRREKKDPARKRSRRHPRSGSRKEATPTGAPPKPVSLDKIRIRSLCRDNIIDVSYEVKINPKETNKAVVSFSFNNISQEVIFSVSLDLTSTANAKFQRPPNSGNSGPFDTSSVIPQKQSKQFSVLFLLQNIVSPQKVAGSLIYTHQNGESPKRKAFEILFPCSSFITPEPISKDEFVQLMRKPGLTLSTATLPSTIKKALNSIQALFRVAMVEDQGSKASMYGRTIQGHHVAILMKEGDAPGKISLAVKTTDKTLGDNLVNELNELFSIL